MQSTIIKSMFIKKHQYIKIAHSAASFFLPNFSGGTGIGSRVKVQNSLNFRLIASSAQFLHHFSFLLIFSNIIIMAINLKFLN